MLVKDLTKLLEDIPQNYIVGFVDKSGKTIDPKGRIVKLDNLKILLIR